MADFPSSLPIRTELNGDVAVQVVDGTVVSQKLTIDSGGRVTTKLNDGSGNAVTSQVNGAQRALDVGIDVAGVQVDPRAIRALTSTDVVTANQGTANTAANGWTIKLTDGTNIAAVKAASTATAASDPSVVVALSPNSPLPAGTNIIGKVSQDTSPWVTKDQADGPVSPGTVASFSQLMGAQYNTALPAPTNGQQVAVQVDATSRLITRLLTATDVVSSNIRDATGTAFSTTNPLPVTLTLDNAGTEINDYATSIAVAAAASVNHDYTVTALKTLLLAQIEATASGKMKIEIQIETGVASGVFTSKFVQFNSTANPNMSVLLASPISVAAGVRVRVIQTNKDNQAQDLYSTICGQEV